jgi:DNA modification methylase
MVGALQAGWDYVIGIEREAEYVEIAERRLASLDAA